MTLSLTALGLINALGSGQQQVARALFAGKRDGVVLRRDLIPRVDSWVGVVEADLPDVPTSLRHYDCRNNRLAMAALAQIAPEIDAARRRHGAGRIAVILGTSTSGIAEGEAALAHRVATDTWPNGFDYRQQEPGNLAAFVADLLELGGPAYTVHTACSSSGKAFASAVRLLRAGFCDAAVVGGADSLCGTTLRGFHSLEALSSRPLNAFSRNRDGTNIGEGAAMFLLQPAAGTPGQVQLLGFGESSDAHHISAPDPAGAGARLAMEHALASASLPPEAISYVNLHGTATPLNDRMEGAAVASLFGTAMPCSSTKAMTGHTLGAASATEAAFLYLSLDHRISGGALPPHLWDGVRDPEIAPIRLVEPGTHLPPGGPRAMLSSSYAFGGSNVALILGTDG